MGVRAPVALRVNPDVDPQTHPYIATGLKTSKFGVPYDEALLAYEEAAKMPGLEIIGADMHIGSQLTKATPVADAVARIVALVKTLRERSIEIRMIDIGGGLGIRYRDETPPTHEEYATVLLPALRESGATVLLEPGRSIVGNAGVLLTRVLYRKDTGAKKFVVDRRRHERSDPAVALRLLSRHPRGRRGGAPSRARDRGRRGPDLRVGRLPGQGPGAAAGRAGRPPGPDERGSVRLRDGLQLQHADRGRPRCSWTATATRSCAAGRRTRTWWRGRRPYEPDVPGFIRRDGHPVPERQGRRGEAPRAGRVPRRERHRRPDPVRHHRRVPDA